MDFNLQDLMKAMSDENMMEDVGKALEGSGIDSDMLEGFSELFSPENADGLESILGEALDIIGSGSDGDAQELVDSAVIMTIGYVKQLNFTFELDGIVITRGEVPFTFEIAFLSGGEKTELDFSKIQPPELWQEILSLSASCAVGGYDEEDLDDFYNDLAYALREFDWESVCGVSDDFAITVE